MDKFCTRSTARSEPGSRPASSALYFSEVLVIVMSSLSRRAWSEVTMMPGDQCTPLELKRGRAWTATTEALACSTRVANSFENDASDVGIRVLLGAADLYLRGWFQHASYPQFGTSVKRADRPCLNGQGMIERSFMYTVRKLGGEDRAAFRALRLLALALDSDSFVMTAEEEAVVPRLNIEDALDQPGPSNFFLGAFDGDELIGMAGLITSSLRKIRHTGILT